MHKLLLDEIRSTSEDLQARVRAEVDETYEIFCRVDYERYLVDDITRSERLLAKGPILGKRTNEWEQGILENISQFNLRLEALRREGKYDTANDEYTPTRIYRGLVLAVNSRGCANYDYRLDSFCFGSRAHFFFDFYREDGVCRLYLQSNSPHEDSDLQKVSWKRLKEEWSRAGFATR